MSMRSVRQLLVAVALMTVPIVIATTVPAGSVSAPPPLAMALQREHHGLTFTEDGRCPWSIIHVNKKTSPRISRRPFHGKLTPK